MGIMEQPPSTPTPAPCTIRRYRPGKDGAWYAQHQAKIMPLTDAPLDAQRTWVAEIAGRAVGICSWQVSPEAMHRAMIDRLWLEPTSRHRGIGRALLKRTTSDARRTIRKLGARVQEVVVTASHEDAAAVRFLEAMKFDTHATPPAREING